MGVLEVLAIVSLVAVAALVQSLTGFGFALLIVPPLVLLLGPRDAVVLANVLGTAIAAVMLVQLRSDVQWRPVVILVAASTAGMPFGLLVLLYLDPGVLQVLIAALVIVFTILLMRGANLGTRLTTTGSIASGVVAGVLRTSTSMAGPPVVLYLQGTGIASGAFRSTIAAFFFVSGMLGVLTFAVEGSLDARLGGVGLLAAPAVFAGLHLGGRLYAHVEEVRFRGIVFAVLIVSAVVAIVGALPW